MVVAQLREQLDHQVQRVVLLSLGEQRHKERAERVEVSGVGAKRDAGGRHRVREDMRPRRAIRKGHVTQKALPCNEMD